MSAFTRTHPLLPDLIEQHGKWQKSRPALRLGDRSLSWGEFDAATSRVAAGLLAEGLQPGERIAVLMHNSIEMVEVLFGAGKAGICVVPLNLSVADDALAAMLLDCGATAVAASREQCGRVDRLLGLESTGRLKIRLGHEHWTEGWTELRAWQERQPPRRPAIELDPDAECNVIYSSGTTSVPKGIVHSQLCRINTAYDLSIALGYHSGAVALSSLSLYSNISWVPMVCTILNGGTLVISPEFTPAGLVETVRRYRITHGVFVPVQLQRLLEQTKPDPAAFHSLQAIMVCGSPLVPELKRAAQERLGCQLIELYGLTEGLVTTLAPEDFNRKLESVGKPIPGQLLKIVDDEGREVPSGEAGEIVGIGRLVMERYLNRPDATAEATWADAQGRHWLRTGDIGRLDEEGFLYLVDRKKDLILSGAQNIYPVDIERVVQNHPAVAEVAVVGVPSARWGESPMALIVPRPAAQVDEAELMDWANARLGKQQRICAVAIVGSLPRNANGKVLKRELRLEYAGGGDRTT